MNGARLRVNERPSRGKEGETEAAVGPDSLKIREEERALGIATCPAGGTALRGESRWANANVAACARIILREEDLAQVLWVGGLRTGLCYM